MMPAILVFNAGSSSVKFALYVQATLDILCRGQIANIGIRAEFSATGVLASKLTSTFSPPLAGNHDELTRWLLKTIARELTEIEICAAGHRVVHGGARFTDAARITPEVMVELETYIPLAPNHQPHNLAAISSVAASWPDIVQFACFDTAFHRTQPRVAEIFALPRALSDEGILRYGFHGLSYSYIANVLPEIIGERSAGRIVVAHLGHGASLCAMVNRCSLGTSMGFTPLDGLMMGKRCGNLDPGVVLYLLQHKGMTAAQVGHLLSNESGLLGVSGVSDDIRELRASDSPSAGEALDLFVHCATRELGALIATIGGLDTLVFTAGIGENSAFIRQRIADRFAWLGAAIDGAANEADETLISTA
ncbi:MAG: acetate kinase, partial [Gammaproteobacteria bacterium]